MLAPGMAARVARMLGTLLAKCQEREPNWKTPRCVAPASRNETVVLGCGPRPALARAFRSSKGAGHPHGWPALLSGLSSRAPSQ